MRKAVAIPIVFRSATRVFFAVTQRLQSLRCCFHRQYARMQHAPSLLPPSTAWPPCQRPFAASCNTWTLLQHCPLLACDNLIAVQHSTSSCLGTGQAASCISFLPTHRCLCPLPQPAARQDHDWSGRPHDQDSCIWSRQHGSHYGRHHCQDRLHRVGHPLLLLLLHGTSVCPLYAHPCPCAEVAVRPPKGIHLRTGGSYAEVTIPCTGRPALMHTHLQMRSTATSQPLTPRVVGC